MNLGENFSLLVNEKMSGRRKKIFILITDMNRKRMVILRRKINFQAIISFFPLKWISVERDRRDSMLVGGPFVSLFDSKSAKSRNFFNTSLRSPSPAALYTVSWFSPGSIRTSEIIANPAWIVNTPI